MAEIQEVREEIMKQNQTDKHEFASNTKGNAALSLGIIGTALAAVGMGVGGALFGNSGKKGHAYLSKIKIKSILIIWEIKK